MKSLSRLVSATASAPPGRRMAACFADAGRAVGDLAEHRGDEDRVEALVAEWEPGPVRLHQRCRRDALACDGQHLVLQIEQDGVAGRPGDVRTEETRTAAELEHAGAGR